MPQENLKDIKKFAIIFDENSTHQDVLKQFVDGLTKNRFAPKGEVMDMLGDAKILLKNGPKYSEVKK